MKRLALAGVLFASCLDWEALSPPPAAVEGFGASTEGGSTQAVYKVTTLNDSGAGSLRDAISQSNRRIEFSVGGAITTSKDFLIAGKSFLTIDGSTAPPPGITLQGAGLHFENGAHDVVVRHLRSRNASDDAFRVYASHDIVFDHVSAAGQGGGALDITEGSQNVTVQWSVLRKTGDVNAASTMLVAFGTQRVSLHHNLYWGPQGNPLVDGAMASATETTADVRNNLVWNWGADDGASYGNGLVADHGARVNAVDNFFEAHGNYNGLAGLAIAIDPTGTGSKVFTGDGKGNAATAFDAPKLAAQSACAAVKDILAGAGAQPRDMVDKELLAHVKPVGCP